MFLGFMMAALAVKLDMQDYPPTKSWMVPVLVLAVPILDTLLVTVSRLRRGLHPIQHPGKDHLAHRLLTLGFGQRAAVLSLYAAGAVAGGAAYVLLQMDAVYANIAAGCFFALGAIIILALEKTDYERQESVTESA